VGAGTWESPMRNQSKSAGTGACTTPAFMPPQENTPIFGEA
jgi:hypothetical protein